MNKFNVHRNYLISLSGNIQINEGEIITVGWGCTQPDGHRRSDTLNQVTVTIISNEECAAILNLPIHPKQICVVPLPGYPYFLSSVVSLSTLNNFSYNAISFRNLI